jgi:hypothetical protein
MLLLEYHLGNAKPPICRHLSQFDIRETAGRNYPAATPPLAGRYKEPE